MMNAAKLKTQSNGKIMPERRVLSKIFRRYAARFLLNLARSKYRVRKSHRTPAGKKRGKK